MREYEVTITETLEMTVTVEAESREEAQQIASDLSLIHISEPTRPY